MKKRLLSITAILALCLALLSVTALAEDTITVNGVDATDTAAVTAAFGEGKVSYDADTNTLTINGALAGGTSISGNGTTDIVINGGDSTAAYGLTVTGAKNVKVTANSGGSTVNGATEISCSGDVNITNNGIGMAVPSNLTITGAQDVEVTANSNSPAIGGATEISCTGNVSITNNGTGQAVADRLTVNGVDDQPAQNVTVSANSSHPAISGHTAITCSGNVEITNSGTGMAVGGTLTVNGAQDVTVTANNGQAVSGTLTVEGAQNVTVTANSSNSAITNNVSIACSGDVEITNNGNGSAVSGTLTVTGAKNVKVTANSSDFAIKGDSNTKVGANITCSGDVEITNGAGAAVGGTLTVNDAQNVTVTANGGPAAIGFNFDRVGADITCSGDVEITNNGNGQAVGYTLIVHSAQDVKVTANSFSCTINNGAEIACSGNVEIVNQGGGNAFAVQGSLTVNHAQDVTVTANSGQAVSQTLTVNDAQNVKVTANSSLAATANNVSITCSGNVEIVNQGTGKAVGFTLTFQQSNGHSYTVKTGSSLETLAVYAEKAEGATFEVESLDASAVKIESADHTPGEWEYNSTQHWRLCTVCGKALDRADHTFRGNTCTVCGYTKPVYVPTYLPTVEQPDEGGTVTVSPKNPTAGSKVTITPKPDEGYEVDEITVTDKNGNPVEVTDNGDGTYCFTQPAGKVTIKVVFRDATVVPFVDVPADEYYYDAVQWAVKNGITYGTSDTTFSPNAPCTRAQVVTFLWRAAGCPTPKSAVNPFTDVKAGSYYQTAVLWAVENGITVGTNVEGTTFSPDAVCSRTQIVTFLWRAQGTPDAGTGNPFKDVAADAYYADAVLWAVKNGITEGTNAAGTTFSPDDNCTRAQIVTFLYRCLGDE